MHAPIAARGSRAASGRPSRCSLAALHPRPWHASHAQDGDALAKAAQNPVAAMISLPLQNNTFFGVGPHGDVANVLNIQPVVPIEAGELEHHQPDDRADDLRPGPGPGPERHRQRPAGRRRQLRARRHQPELLLLAGRRRAGDLGVGPSLTVPTATDDSLGSEKWSAGPAAVALTMPGNWVVGSLVRQLWSFAGDGDRQDVNQTLIQPFVNYNFPGGWYAVSSPIITANWEADSDDTWTVPVGGGLGKIFKIGGQAMNAAAQAFYNVESPSTAPTGRSASSSSSCFRNDGRRAGVRRSRLPDRAWRPVLRAAAAAGAAARGRAQRGPPGADRRGPGLGRAAAAGRSWPVMPGAVPRPRGPICSISAPGRGSSSPWAC